MGSGINGLHVKQDEDGYCVKRYDHTLDIVLVLSSFKTIDDAMSYARTLVAAELDEVERTLKKPHVTHG